MNKLGWLQWGHVLSDVETKALVSAMTPKELLQWGHVLSDVETPERYVRALPPKYRFNGATSCRTWKPDQHSAAGPPFGQLQWGHGLSDVETRLLLSYVLLHPLLQWGHVLSDVETTRNHPEVRHTSYLLQWGHVLSDVETVRRASR